jgi:hypothetical protein
MLRPNLLKTAKDCDWYYPKLIILMYYMPCKRNANLTMWKSWWKQIEKYVISPNKNASVASEINKALNIVNVIIDNYGILWQRV